jgi:hypothetical protein
MTLLDKYLSRRKYLSDSLKKSLYDETSRINIFPASDILVYQYLVILLDSHTMRLPSISAFKTPKLSGLALYFWRNQLKNILKSFETSNDLFFIKSFVPDQV